MLPAISRPCVLVLSRWPRIRLAALTFQDRIQVTISQPNSVQTMVLMRRSKRAAVVTRPGKAVRASDNRVGGRANAPFASCAGSRTASGLASRAASARRHHDVSARSSPTTISVNATVAPVAGLATAFRRSLARSSTAAWSATSTLLPCTGQPILQIVSIHLGSRRSGWSGWPRYKLLSQRPEM